MKVKWILGKICWQNCPQVKPKVITLKVKAINTGCTKNNHRATYPQTQKKNYVHSMTHPKVVIEGKACHVFRHKNLLIQSLFL